MRRSDEPRVGSACRTVRKSGRSVARLSAGDPSRRAWPPGHRRALFVGGWSGRPRRQNTVRRCCTVRHRRRSPPAGSCRREDGPTGSSRPHAGARPSPTATCHWRSRPRLQTTRMLAVGMLAGRLPAPTRHHAHPSTFGRGPRRAAHGRRPRRIGPRLRARRARVPGGGATGVTRCRFRAPGGSKTSCSPRATARRWPVSVISPSAGPLATNSRSERTVRRGRPRPAMNRMPRYRIVRPWFSATVEAGPSGRSTPPTTSAGSWPPGWSERPYSLTVSVAASTKPTETPAATPNESAVSSAPSSPATEYRPSRTPDAATPSRTQTRNP